ncbi:MAG: DEAD/DEAH box helicase [bacterium]
MKPTFKDLFQQATGEARVPFPYQEKLAVHAKLPKLIDVPTGLGKTAAAVLAWLWRRRFADEKIRADTPRRLVYCLPMRVLVEQTYSETIWWLDQLGMLAGAVTWDKRAAKPKLLSYTPEPETVLAADGWASQHGETGPPIAVHLLMGGEESTDWALWPERDAILIGTQDMLLSRALNRGYAAGRARWPLEFGLLNNDCFWVFDEVQLMDTGLATSLQLDAWRESLMLRPTASDFPKPVPNHGSRPCRSLWMSATMSRQWLEKAVDWAPQTTKEWDRRIQLSPEERTDEKLRTTQLFKVRKQLTREPVAVLQKPNTKDNKVDKHDADRKQATYLEQFAAHIRDNHARSGLTLVIVNTVERATRLYKLLTDDHTGLGDVEVRLMHSRFRPMEREGWRDFLDRRDPAPRILVSTQVVEAGVDLSAAVLYTELAPWASLVQRFGRCARYPGESGIVYWLNLDLGSEKQPAGHWAKPYGRPELIVAREVLKNLKDVGLKSLTEVKDRFTKGENPSLFPYEPRFVPRDKDLFDFFDTTPDLTGADVDVSRYIREGVELDVQLFWREVPAASEPDDSSRPQRRELCPVPCYIFQQSLADLIKNGRIWRRNYQKGWEQVYPCDEDRIYPGQVYLLERACGGYSPLLGWTGKPDDTGFDLAAPTNPSKETLQDDEEDRDDLSKLARWLTIFEHTRDVSCKLNVILKEVAVPESDKKILRLAARWHDRGKAHPVFISKLNPIMLAADDVIRQLAGEPAAKAPDEAWSNSGSRRGFRHELASALALIETLRRTQPDHVAFAWPEGLPRTHADADLAKETGANSADDELATELAKLSAEEFDLLVYLVAAHHGKVRMSIRSSPSDHRIDVDDPCPEDKRQARGVRDDDLLPACRIPSSSLAAGVTASEVKLSLDLMELGLSPRYGTSWRERMQLLLERVGPFRLAYLEGLLRAADCRASREEDRPVRPREEPV